MSVLDNAEYNVLLPDSWRKPKVYFNWKRPKTWYISFKDYIQDWRIKRWWKHREVHTFCNRCRGLIDIQTGPQMGGAGWDFKIDERRRELDYNMDGRVVTSCCKTSRIYFEIRNTKTGDVKSIIQDFDDREDRTHPRSCQNYWGRHLLPPVFEWQTYEALLTIVPAWNNARTQSPELDDSHIPWDDEELSEEELKELEEISDDMDRGNWVSFRDIDKRRQMETGDDQDV